MPPRFTFLAIFALLTGASGFGQIIPGVGYPGGGYPGGGYPGGGYPGGGYPGGGYPGQRYPQGGPNGQGRNGRGNQDSSASTLTGIVRKIEDNKVVLEADDKSIDTILIGSFTKYASASGGAGKLGDFQPGDHVSVDVKQDNRKAYHAHKMTMVREGTTDEHAAASQAMDDLSRPLQKGEAASSSASNTPPASSGDHPVLRRASSSSSGNSGDSASSASGSSSDNDPDRPVLRRAPASSGSVAGSSTRLPDTGNATSSSDSSGDGPPRLRRATSSADGSPKAEIEPGSAASAASSSTTAASRPSIAAGDANGVTRMPPPPRIGSAQDGASQSGDGSSYPSLQIPQRAAVAGSGDPVIDQAREAAFSFSETLPNYVVKQYTTRYETAAARGGHTSWQALDNVTADVIEEDGTEKYKNILVNGKPPKDDVEKTGSWSKGEYSSLQLDVLSPSTNADFHGKRATTIVNRPAFRYDFSVEQPNSHWHVEAEGQSYLPAYTGSIWIDKSNYRVLRIELAARNMPGTFPLDTVESAVDYDYVNIGESKYLLPIHSEALSCVRGTSECSRNVIEFRNYRKFSAETSITFDPGN